MHSQMALIRRTSIMSLDATMSSHFWDECRRRSASEFYRGAGRRLKQTTAAILAVVLLAGVGGRAEGGQSTNLDNTILALAVTDRPLRKGYLVVHPTAELHRRATSQAKQLKDFFGYFVGPGTNAVVELLVDQLFERNQTNGTGQAIRLTLSSSLTNGYVVDYDGRYAKYFLNGGGSWERFEKENPGAQGFVTFSLPVFDEKTGLVLLCRGTDYGFLSGKTEVILYRYERGKLKRLIGYTLEIS